MEVHNALQNLRKNPGPQSVSSCFVLQNFSSCMLLLKCFSISVNGDIFRTPTKMGQKKNIFMLLGTWNNEHTSYSSHWCSAYSTDRQHYVQRPKMFTKLMAQPPWLAWLWLCGSFSKITHMYEASVGFRTTSITPIYVATSHVR